MEKNPTPLEGAEQRALFAWAKLNERSHPELALLHAIPNGGKRNPREAANLKAQGVKAGVPDICLPVPRGGCASLYIELKRRQGGRPTQAQYTQRPHKDGQAMPDANTAKAFGFDDELKAFMA